MSVTIIPKLPHPMKVQTGYDRELLFALTAELTEVRKELNALRLKLEGAALVATLDATLGNVTWHS